MTTDRFDLYGALWLFCSRHSGQSSRGYRILSRLSCVYSPGLSIRSNRFESSEQREIYRRLLAHRNTV
jgi:hypothetical protein